jgi:uncharacterized protein YbaR (Trm112 family)
VISPDFLKILCCPETHQDLKLADQALLDKLNEQIRAGSLKSRAGKPVADKLDGGLIRADGKFLYPVRHDIPVMLIDAAIPLN